MRLSFSLIILLFSICSHAQVRFTASVNPKKVAKDSYVEITYSINNGEDSEFNPPSFKPFKKVGNPSVQTSVSIINGSQKSTKSYVFTLIATTEGKFNFGPASAIINGKKLNSNPVKVEVMKVIKRDDQIKDAFVKIIASDSTVYLGQQICLKYKLYTKINVKQYTINDESTYDGFYTQSLDRNSRFQREIINGEEYYTKDLQKIALFPQQVGQYDIPDTYVTLGISNTNSNSFFTRIDKRKNVIAEGISITVMDLPPNRPKSFSGAVGKYSVTVQTDNRNISTDDAIIFRMNILGNGDPKLVDPPNFPVPDNVEWYDPNTLLEESYNRGTDFVNNKEQYEYILVPKEKGRYNIEPEFSYFDVDSNKYVILSPRLPSINVRQGTNFAKDTVPEKDEVEIVDIKTKTNLKKIRNQRFNKVLYAGGTSLLSLFGLSLFLLFKRLEKEGHFDEMVQRKKKAKLKIIEEIELEFSKLKPSQNKEGAEVLSLKLRKYINQKFKETDDQLTDQDIIDLFIRKNIPAELVQKTKTFLSQTEQIIYAGISAIPLSSLKDDVIDIINQIESFIESSP